MYVLPIINTMLEIGPFCGVMGVCIFAASNLYYAFDHYDAFDSFIVMYRLAVLGDFDLEEMEKNPFAYSDMGEFSSVAIRMMLLVISFCMSITLMNLYIGVLTVN